MKKIMFNDRFELTAAVLGRWKTQTRRIVSDNTISKYKEHEDPTIIDDARYWIDDIVAIAQSYDAAMKTLSGEDKRWIKIMENTSPMDAGRSNKMFVKADLMPHQIQITGVNVERLQNITAEDCIKEGVKKVPDFYGKGDDVYMVPNLFKDRQDAFVRNIVSRDPIEVYAELINRISGKGTWESNPWVFVYDFKLIR